MTDAIPSDPGGRIVKDPLILAGKPTVKGTRISVELVAGLAQGGAWSREDILRNYPRLTAEDIDACLRYAATGQPLSFVTWEQFEAMLDENTRPAAGGRHPRYAILCPSPVSARSLMAQGDKADNAGPYAGAIRPSGPAWSSATKG